MCPPPTRRHTPLTLVSPCCHHDLQVRMRAADKQAYPPMTRHGILRERLGRATQLHPGYPVVGTT